MKNENKNINSIKSDKWFLCVTEENFEETLSLIAKCKENIQYFSYFRDNSKQYNLSTYKIFFKFYLIYSFEDLKDFITFGHWEICRQDIDFVAKYFKHCIYDYEKIEIEDLEKIDKLLSSVRLFEKSHKKSEIHEENHIIVYGQKSYTNVLTNLSDDECKLLIKVLSVVNARYKQFDFDETIVGDVENGNQSN